jgi:D-psicose/D-tagatose/L-ribulose 3-epimerase
MLGINVLLWTTDLARDHRPLLEMLRSVGYDLVEMPLLQTDPASCSDLSELLDELGFARTAVTIRFAADNPISPDPVIRRLGVENSKHAVECAAALGARVLGGPFHSAHGQCRSRGLVLHGRPSRLRRDCTGGIIYRTA